MIHFPKDPQQAAALAGSLRAGGTDLQERRHLGLDSGALVDLRDCAGLDRRQRDAQGLHLGAGLDLQSLADDPEIQRDYPGLAQAAGGLATPQIRHRATLGGSLLQEVRCWYYRHPDQRCAKKGGATCLARSGDHLFHACFDTGLCIAPHPATMALPLWAYAAQVELDDGQRMDIPTLLGDGQDPRRTHHLPPGRVLVAVHLPAPTTLGESAAYGRAISRARAEWPLVEGLVRFKLAKKGPRMEDVGVFLGGVANRPVRLSQVEAALQGQPPSAELFAQAAALAVEGANPLPMTAYKLRLIPGLLQDLLARAAGGAE